MSSSQSSQHSPSSNERASIWNLSEQVATEIIPTRMIAPSGCVSDETGVSVAGWKRTHEHEPGDRYPCPGGGALLSPDPKPRAAEVRPRDRDIGHLRPREGGGGVGKLGEDAVGGGFEWDGGKDLVDEELGAVAGGEGEDCFEGDAAGGVGEGGGVVGEEVGEVEGRGDGFGDCNGEVGGGLGEVDGGGHCELLDRGRWEGLEDWLGSSWALEAWRLEMVGSLMI